MPRKTKPLSATEVDKAKYVPGKTKLFDGDGLFLAITHQGTKTWRLKYFFRGTERLLTLGTYPYTSLTEARKKRFEARALLEKGIDPGAMKRMLAGASTGENSFELVAREWHVKFLSTWSESHGRKLLGRLEQYLFPWIGARPVGEITAPELLAVIRRIEAKGHLETAHRTLELAGQIFRYSVQTGRAERNPAGDLKGAIPPAKGKRMATITDPEQIGHLLRAIDQYPGAFVTRCALKLAPLFFLRPGELRKAEWSEFDLDAAEWRIPTARMKRLQTEKDAAPGEIGHVVPLCWQAVEVLRELHQMTGTGRFLFPGLRSTDRPLSDATLTNALRRMGYTGDELTVHGLRHMASTLLHELGHPSHLIEKQLGHADRNRIRGIYNHAEYLPERRAMMQSWANHLDELKAGKADKVVPLRRAAG